MVDLSSFLIDLYGRVVLPYAVDGWIIRHCQVTVDGFQACNSAPKQRTLRQAIKNTTIKIYAFYLYL